MKSVLMGTASSLTRPREKRREKDATEGGGRRETGDSFVRFLRLARRRIGYTGYVPAVISSVHESEILTSRAAASRVRSLFSKYRNLINGDIYLRENICQVTRLSSFSFFIPGIAPFKKNIYIYIYKIKNSVPTFFHIQIFVCSLTRHDSI